MKQSLYQYKKTLKQPGISPQIVLVFSFETIDKQNNFISELCKTTFDKAHFLLDNAKKATTCELTLFAENQQALNDTENRIAEIAYNVDHHEKNKWWIWQRD